MIADWEWDFLSSRFPVRGGEVFGGRIPYEQACFHYDASNAKAKCICDPANFLINLEMPPKKVLVLKTCVHRRHMTVSVPL